MTNYKSTLKSLKLKKKIYCESVKILDKWVFLNQINGDFQGNFNFIYVGNWASKEIIKHNILLKKRYNTKYKIYYKKTKKNSYC